MMLDKNHKWTGKLIGGNKWKPLKMQLFQVQSKTLTQL
jgi:hypothetical protein